MRFITSVLLGLILPIFLYSQSISISKTWKFQTGDNMSFKEESFDDSTWKTIQVPGYWENQGWKNYSGAAWYRVSVSLSANLMTEDLILDLGQVDDIDETYWNGEIIGFTGKFPPNTQASHSQIRRYKIPKNLLKTENTLAVRVYDTEGEGGICCNANLSIYPYRVYEKKVEEIRKNKSSYYQLTTSNGLISAVYNSKEDVIENIYPHIFAAIDSAVYVKPFASNLKTNRKDKPIEVKYLDNTHVIQVKYKDLTINYLASFTKEDKTFYFEAIGAPHVIKDLRFSYENELGQIHSQSFETKKGVSSYYGSIQYNPENLVEDGSKSIPSDLTLQELHFMKNIFDKCKYPEHMTKDELNAFEQSISIMKMSQVSDKEIFPHSHGQVLASLRPGSWAISWVRDGAYALMAMARVGMYDEAKKGLEFMLKAQSNRFKNYIHTDGKNYGPGVDYQISLTRYFGNGKEECDYNENGPNIEFDDWGLFLTAFHEYITRSNDWDCYRKWQPLIHSKIGDAIIHIIQDNGLLQRDSGPWEHHLPGKQYVFTNAVNSVGLKKLAELDRRIGLDGEKYAAASERIYQGVMKNMLINNSYIKGNFQETDPSDRHYYDGATFELFASDFINNKMLFESHMQEYDKQLIVNPIYGKGRGYIRFNSFDSYENQEWPFAGLRVAMAQIKFGNLSKAKPQIDRITEYAKHNYNQIPEILTNEDIQYTGAIPMVGYGAGAYILALSDYYDSKDKKE